MLGEMKYIYINKNSIDHPYIWPGIYKLTSNDLAHVVNTHPQQREAGRNSRQYRDLKDIGIDIERRKENQTHRTNALFHAQQENKEILF